MNKGDPSDPSLINIVCQQKFRFVDLDRYQRDPRPSKLLQDSVYGWHKN